LRSQALIHLRSEYCDRGRRLQCRFGYTLLREAESGKPAFAMEPIVRNPQRKRKAVVAMDSWKGCLSAAEATSAAAEGLRSRGWECLEMPMADGGEGTASILAGASGAQRITVATADPLG
ncbi:MAG: glycerate kinase, partial [Muribaculaceae bacterium]|nr:glycerate kinase [Muribaculaceae bacterium]